ncbi:hypothetical protein BWQ96_04602 [Gracilariopsis chorda]|uniref:Uncharacterized protein n=1 Tax=Gracilariopsis chorda TaxID=448386 RepID=A0A2V3IV65_9FLOR|nr:hypothetical protein BWQ96_04602 [Gracilariopsis chorda]|eukprot:PXF45597.1 hypothetical protein BWQ96_04602 [Gracilariopsis chorda]
MAVVGKCAYLAFQEQVRVCEYIANISTNPILFPSNVWWVLLSGVSRFMSCVDVCFRSIQGKEMLICEHKSHCRAFCDDLRTIGDIKGPLYGMEMLKTVTEIEIAAESGNYVMDATAVRTFLVEISSKVLNDFNSLSENEKGKVVTILPSVFLLAYLKLSALSAE